MPTPSTSIRVSVQWADRPIFAGEDVECKITFTNVAPQGSPDPTSASPRQNGTASREEALRKAAPASSSRGGHKVRSMHSSQAKAAPVRGHRQTMSLTVPKSGVGKSNLGSAPTQANGTPKIGNGHKHQRSISIISLGGSEAEDRGGNNQSGAGRVPNRRHARSSSLQIIPRRTSVANSGSSPLAPSGFRSATQPATSPYHSSSATYFDARAPPSFTLHGEHVRRTAGVMTTPNTPALSSAKRPSLPPSQSFRFPAKTPSPRAESRFPGVEQSVAETQSGPRIAFPPSEATTPPEVAEVQSRLESLPPLSKVISVSSVNDVTPRSSGELFALSNNSSETLASEYVSQSTNRLLPQAYHAPRPSQLGSTASERKSELLVMGYAQISGSFTVDGSLVNQAPFEEVKRKGVIGGQAGGGVVGVGIKREGGLFGAFGWGNIGESIGSLLKTEELSSLKEMKSIARSKAIPLLSTPQSVLFVDLRLEPGESRTYKYAFTLPRGLPPSHKGKAIRVSYTLVIGTQRADTVKSQQQVRHVDVPFRVFGGIDEQGELLGHDLFAPHVVLTDQARTASLDNLASKSVENLLERGSSSKAVKGSLQEFQSYIGELLNPHSIHSRQSFLQPPPTPHGELFSPIEAPKSMKETIDLAILRGNLPTRTNSNVTHFEIARNGRRVSSITLARPAYRLGETVFATVDFSAAEVACYGLSAMLETHETVDPSLALRSNSSIYRTTRRSYASHSESTLFARKVSCSFMIPLSATPEFLTSGVSLSWRLRFEFLTPRIAGGEEEDEGGGALELLEQVSRDDRGLILAAVERLACETFEVALPLRVYGPVSDDLAKAEASTGEGLSV